MCMHAFLYSCLCVYELKRVNVHQVTRAFSVMYFLGFVFRRVDTLYTGLCMQICGHFWQHFGPDVRTSGH